MFETKIIWSLINDVNSISVHIIICAISNFVAFKGKGKQTFSNSKYNFSTCL